ncbi:GNAT family N-acetyltransferase [Roseibium algae]|uniref:GNAT family N-acetyltransferase n=1 Tax=Roseibium algae TaxID=3123038 RepID=A0ABU8TLD9_9HYPH
MDYRRQDTVGRMIKVPDNTERLAFREACLDDAAFYLKLMNEPGYLAYIGNKDITDVGKAAAYIEINQLQSYRVNGFGSYVAQRKSDGQLLGFSGIYRRDGFDVPDIGYAFLSGYHGKGYAREAATSTLAHAEHNLGFKELCAIVSPDNDRSIKLLKAIGFSWSHSRTYPATNDPIEVFSWKALGYSG